MNEICEDTPITKTGLFVEVAYIYSCIGKYGIRKSLLSAQEIVSATHKIVLIKGNIKFGKLKDYIDKKNSMLSIEKRLELDRLVLKLF